MGTTYVDGIVAGPAGKTERVEFLVDSGAVYSLLPYDVWQRIELVPKRRQEFRLADGTPFSRRISECRITLPQGEAQTPVILGETGDLALLGMVTLEELGVVLHPFDRSIRPMGALPM